MKLLVTGGAGFIGSHLLELLNSDKNYEVVVLDNLSSGFRENVPQGMRLVVADIRSQEIEALFQKENFDAVVHLAAQTMVPYSIEHPDEDCEINLAGLINVLENCRKYKVKTVLFASSAAVYGNNENVPLHEDLALMPMSFYGITKMTSEHYLRVYHELYGINTVVFRFANVYGERQGEGGEGGVVSIFCKLLAAGKAVTVYGNGEQKRDFVFQFRKNQFRISCDDIVYFEKKGRQAVIHTISENFKANMTTEEIWKQLDDKVFAHIHVSYIINLGYIRAIEGDEVVMDNEERLLIARSHKQNLKEKHMEFVRRMV